MPRQRSKDNPIGLLTELCTIDGYTICITLTNNLVVRTPDGKSGSPWIDRFKSLHFSGNIHEVPIAVEAKIRVAVANRERARMLRKQAERSEPPDDMREIRY